MLSFHFNTKFDQTILLGLRAKNAAELLAGIKHVPNNSIYHHTHRFLQRHHYLSPEPPNDFAYWITAMTNDDALGERLASIDVVQFHTIAELRNAFTAVLEEHKAAGGGIRDCIAGEEFQFMATRTFVLATPVEARTLGEFHDALKNVSIKSLYYHVFDARLRLEQRENDFSRWFRDLGYAELADAVTRLDPYNYTLEGLRTEILELVESYDSH